MKRVIIKSLLVLSFQALFLSVACTQYVTNVTVTDIGNDALSQKINAGASALLTEFNTAFHKERKPSLAKIRTLSKDSKMSIPAIWKTTSPFRCIESEIIERAERLTAIRYATSPFF
jgi:hypothetical protein